MKGQERKEGSKVSFDTRNVAPSSAVRPNASSPRRRQHIPLSTLI